MGRNPRALDRRALDWRLRASIEASGGPARRANLRTGDVVLAVGGQEVSDLAGFFRTVWSLGKAGIEVPLTIYRDGRTLEGRVCIEPAGNAVLRNRSFPARARLRFPQVSHAAGIS